MPMPLPHFPQKHKTAVNIYVIGEEPVTSWAGYAFSPGADDDPFYGHVGLSWSSLSTGEGGGGKGGGKRGENTRVRVGFVWRVRVVGAYGHLGPSTGAASAPVRGEGGKEGEREGKTRVCVWVSCGVSGWWGPTGIWVRAPE